MPIDVIRQISITYLLQRLCQFEETPRENGPLTAYRERFFPAGKRTGK